MTGQAFRKPGRFHDRCAFQRANTLVSSKIGANRSAWNRVHKARIRCGTRRSRRVIARLGLCGQCNFCSDTRRWTAQFATCVSNWKMRRQFPKPLKSKGVGPLVRGGQNRTLVVRMEAATPRQRTARSSILRHLERLNGKTSRLTLPCGDTGNVLLLSRDIDFALNLGAAFRFHRLGDDIGLNL